MSEHSFIQSLLNYKAKKYNYLKITMMDGEDIILFLKPFFYLSIRNGFLKFLAEDKIVPSTIKISYQPYAPYHDTLSFDTFKEKVDRIYQEQGYQNFSYENYVKKVLEGLIEKEILKISYVNESSVIVNGDFAMIDQVFLKFDYKNMKFAFEKDIAINTRQIIKIKPLLDTEELIYNAYEDFEQFIVTDKIWKKNI